MVRYLWTLCNMWHVCRIMYDLGCMLAMNRDSSWYSTDYRIYMSSSIIVRPIVGCHYTCALINWTVLLQPMWSLLFKISDTPSGSNWKNVNLYIRIGSFSELSCGFIPAVQVSALEIGSLSKLWLPRLLNIQFIQLPNGTQQICHLFMHRELALKLDRNHCLNIRNIQPDSP